MSNIDENTDKDKELLIVKKIYANSYAIVILFGIFGFIVILSILGMQYSPRAIDLRKMSTDDINFRESIIPAKKGDIYSADNKLLATNINNYEISLDFAPEGMTDKIFNSNIKGLSKGLASFFKDKTTNQYETILRKCRKNRVRHKVITPRRINYTELQELLKLPLLNLSPNKGGRKVETIHIRHKPYGNLARRTIGKSDTINGFGLEHSFFKELAGKDGLIYERKISGSFWVPDNGGENIEQIDGCDIITTLDIDIQDVTEDALKKAIIKHQADWGCAVLMEVKTGEIKSIANITKNENDFFVEDYNYAIGQLMEPGSTFKLVSLISLLDDAKADIEEKVDCGNGVMYVGARRHKDTKKGLGIISLKEVFEQSSNIGFVKMVEKYYRDDPKQFITDIRDIGFADDIDFQLDGEKTPILHENKLTTDLTSLGMLSIGYSAIEITPLRTLMIFNAIANKGKMISPIIVSEIKKDGKTIKTFKAKTLNSQICSNKTLLNVQKSMEGVIDDGTAKRFLLNKDYRIAGKTGTAQVLVDGKYVSKKGTHYLASFAGYFPADDPKYSCIVAIKTQNSPNGRKSYGGASLAGPVFKAIADRVYSNAIDWGHSIKKPNLNKTEIIQEQSNDFNIKSKKGDIEKVRKILKTLEVDGNNAIFVNKVEINKIEAYDKTHKTIPNVIGMGLQDAIEVLMPLGVNVKTIGKGIITKQSIPVGRKTKKGSEIKLTLSL